MTRDVAANVEMALSLLENGETATAGTGLHSQYGRSNKRQRAAQQKPLRKTETCYQHFRNDVTIHLCFRYVRVRFPILNECVRMCQLHSMKNETNIINLICHYVIVRFPILNECVRMCHCHSMKNETNIRNLICNYVIKSLSFSLLSRPTTD